MCPKQHFKDRDTPLTDGPCPVVTNPGEIFICTGYGIPITYVLSAPPQALDTVFLVCSAEVMSLGYWMYSLRVVAEHV